MRFGGLREKAPQGFWDIVRRNRHDGKVNVPDFRRLDRFTGLYPFFAQSRQILFKLGALIFGIEQQQQPRGLSISCPAVLSQGNCELTLEQSGIVLVLNIQFTFQWLKKLVLPLGGEVIPKPLHRWIVPKLTLRHFLPETLQTREIRGGENE